MLQHTFANTVTFLLPGILFLGTFKSRVPGCLMNFAVDYTVLHLNKTELYKISFKIAVLCCCKLFATECNLLQVVDFNTWSRTINGIKKESLLDHVYIINLETFDSIYQENLIFGDHLLVIVKLTIINLTMWIDSKPNVWDSSVLL